MGQRCGWPAGPKHFVGPPMAHSLLSLIRQTLGLEVRILTGAEEATSSMKAYATAFFSPETKHLVVDIGGGPVEFILGEDNQILPLDEPLPLGVTRPKKPVCAGGSALLPPR